jgi:hypothetical protein
MIKVVAVMQSPFIHARVAKEMAKEAKDRGWKGKLADRLGIGKDLNETELEGAVKVGDTEFDKAVWEEFNNHQQSRKAFAKKQEDETAKQKTLLAKLETSLLRDVYKLKKPKEEAIDRFARENNITVKNVKAMAEGLDI